MKKSRERCPFSERVEADSDTIPGISEVNASAILAEIGVDMSQFPDEAHLSSWAGVCPGIMKVLARRKAVKRRKEIPF
jgi:transposase